MSFRRKPRRPASGMRLRGARRMLVPAAAVLALVLPASSSAAQPAPPGFFGVDALSASPGDFALMAQNDVGVSRAVFPFQLLKQGRHAPYYWGYSDGLVKSSADNGLDLIPIVYGSPPWVSTDLNRTPLRGQSKQAWDDLLVALVGRYGPTGGFWAENPYVPYHPISLWQIWNEPNSRTWWGPKPNPREYATLLRRSARAIHSADPAARIMTAGIVARPTNPFHIEGPAFLRRLLRIRSMTRVADVVAYHPFAPSTARVRRQLVAARHVMRRNHARKTPIWITEIGWGSVGPRSHPLVKSPAGQDRVLRHTFEMVLAVRKRLRVGRLLWYQWRDARDDLCPWCESSGLLDINSQPKRLLSTFAAIATR